jgi:hypothetical protein
MKQIHLKKENLKDGRSLGEKNLVQGGTDHMEMELLRKTKEEEAREERRNREKQ